MALLSIQHRSLQNFMLRDKIYSVNFKHLSRGKSFTSCLIRRQKSLLNTCIKDGNWEWKIKCTSWEEWELRTLIYSANSLKILSVNNYCYLSQSLKYLISFSFVRSLTLSTQTHLRIVFTLREKYFNILILLCFIF